MNIDGDAPLAAAPANVVVRNANTRKVPQLSHTCVDVLQ